MGVAQIEQDAGTVGSGGGCDAVDQRLDLRVDDPDDVDAAQHHPGPVALEHERTGLERQARSRSRSRAGGRTRPSGAPVAARARGMRHRHGTRSWSLLLDRRGCGRCRAAPPARGRRRRGTARRRRPRRWTGRRARHSRPCRAGGTDRLRAGSARTRLRCCRRAPARAASIADVSAWPAWPIEPRSAGKSSRRSAGSTSSQ